MVWVNDQLKVAYLFTKSLHTGEISEVDMSYYTCLKISIGDFNFFNQHPIVMGKMGYLVSIGPLHHITSTKKWL